jgi:hypothetical protein
MKKLFLILTLAILPFQVTWAAVATYCQHEQIVQSSHFGHHEHEHEHEQHAQTGKEQKDSSNKFHSDCLNCHGLVAALVMPVTEAFSVKPASQSYASCESHLKSVPSSRPEKPQWVLAV